MPDDLPFDTHEMSAQQAIQAIEELADPDPETLVALSDHEAAHEDFEGGRKTVLEAISARFDEGGDDNPEPPDDSDSEEATTSAANDAGDPSDEGGEGDAEEEEPEPGEPGSVVTAIVDGQRHRAKVVEKVDALVVELGDVHGTRALVGPDDWK